MLNEILEFALTSMVVILNVSIFSSSAKAANSFSLIVTSEFSPVPNNKSIYDLP